MRGFQFILGRRALIIFLALLVATGAFIGMPAIARTLAGSSPPGSQEVSAASTDSASTEGLPAATGEGEALLEPSGHSPLLQGGSEYGWTKTNTALTGTDTPSARQFHAMAATPSGVLLFGGTPTSGAFFNDTWFFNTATNTWGELKITDTITAPSARYGHAMAATPSGVLLFGGTDGRFRNDTWLFNTTSGAWGLLNTGSASPPPRMYHAMAATPSGVLLFGGWGGSGTPTYFADTWLFTYGGTGTGTWTNVTPTAPVSTNTPSARQGHAMAATPSGAILFGGTPTSGTCNDTWLFNTANRTWDELTTLTTSPSARDFHAMAATLSGVLLFGGDPGGDQTWLFTDYGTGTGIWTNLSTTITSSTPSARHGHAMAYDSQSGKVLLFGGTINVSTQFNDTWLYDPTGSTPTIAVTTPNGGESWPIGSSQAITWTSTNLTGGISIELTRDGTTWETLSPSASNIGSYAWTATGPSSSTCRVRVSSVDSPSLSDSSDADFSIYDAGPWPMFRHDLQHTGRSPYTGPQTPVNKWEFATEGDVSSSPALGSDGTVYVGSTDGKLYALNPNGSKKWEYATENWVYSSPAVGSAGTIYVGSCDNMLYALNPDGSMKWKFATENWVASSPAIGSDGTVYVGSMDNMLYAINPDGSMKWKFATGSIVGSSPAIGSDGTVYVGSDGYKLYAINPDGSKKWEFATGGYVESSPAIGSDGTVYVGSNDKNLYAVNPDGNQKWAFATGNAVRSSPAIGSDGTIYVGSDDNKLYAVNPNGSKKWEFATGNGVYSSPAIGSDGTVYVGSYDNKLYALNPNGSKKWEFATGNNVISSPAIGSNGTVYVGSDDHKLYAIGKSSPTIAVTSPAAGAIWAVGTDQNITWTSTGLDSTKTLTILLARDGVNFTETITKGLSSTLNSYTWTVSGPGTINAKIRVQQDATADASPDYFTITSTLFPYSGTSTLTISDPWLEISGGTDTGTLWVTPLDPQYTSDPDLGHFIQETGKRSALFFDIGQEGLSGKLTIVLHFNHRLGEETFLLFLWDGAGWVNVPGILDSANHTFTFTIKAEDLKGTPFALGGDPVAMPGMNPWGLALLSLALLGMGGWWFIRRRGVA